MTYEKKLEVQINDLQEYAVTMVTSLGYLTLMKEHHKSAALNGIMPEDMMSRAKSFMWDLQRLAETINLQLNDVFEISPEVENVQMKLKSIQDKEHAYLQGVEKDILEKRNKKK